MSIYDANANPSSTFKMYKNLAKKPFGNGLFSLAVSAKAVSYTHLTLPTKA